MRLVLIARLFAFALCAIFVCANPALAADSHGGEGGGGMLDKLKFTGITRWDLGVYTLIVFGLLMFVLGKFAWPKIIKGLAEREAKIGSEIDQAKKDRAEAAALKAQAEQERAEASLKAKAIMDEARKDAEALKAEKVAEGEKKAKEIEEGAKRDVEQERLTLEKEAQAQVVQLATLIATKALRRQVTIENQNELLAESIAELKSNGSQA